MPLRVTRAGPLSIAEQIATQLRELIRAGRLRPGDRLPPVRVLAGFLRVNRNTVAKVYASLERSGVLSTTPGRGTFVTSGDGPRSSGALLPLPRIGFVECNASDLAYFSRQIADRLRIPLTPVLLKDLGAATDTLDIIATTMFHIEEVRKIAPRHEVIGLMALPEFATLDAVAHVAPDARVALVCATEEGVRSKAQSIRAVGIRRPRLVTATLQQSDRVRAILKHSDVVLASPRVLERIGDHIPPRAQVIPFASVLGDGALGLLAARIRAWR